MLNDIKSIINSRIELHESSNAIIESVVNGSLDDLIILNESTTTNKIIKFNKLPKDIKLKIKNIIRTLKNDGLNVVLSGDGGKKYENLINDKVSNIKLKKFIPVHSFKQCCNASMTNNGCMIQLTNHIEKTSESGDVLFNDIVNDIIGLLKKPLNEKYGIELIADNNKTIYGIDCYLSTEDCGIIKKLIDDGKAFEESTIDEIEESDDDLFDTKIDDEDDDEYDDEDEDNNDDNDDHDDFMNSNIEDIDAKKSDVNDTIDHNNDIMNDTINPEDNSTPNAEPAVKNTTEDNIDDILSVTINIKSNTITDILPIPPTEAANTIPTGEAEDNNTTRVDSGFGESSKSITEAISLDDSGKAPDDDQGDDSKADNKDAKDTNDVTDAVLSKVKEVDISDDEENDNLLDDTINDDTSKDSTDDTAISNNNSSIFKKLGDITKSIEDVKMSILKNNN